jgi:hypothetical protein
MTSEESSNKRRENSYRDYPAAILNRKLSIMKNKGQIKVIKKDERNRVESAEPKISTRQATKEAARDMVSTVSTWVNDFQQRRRAETTQAIKTLFGERPEPSGA